MDEKHADNLAEVKESTSSVDMVEIGVVSVATDNHPEDLTPPVVEITDVEDIPALMNEPDLDCESDAEPVGEISEEITEGDVTEAIALSEPETAEETDTPTVETVTEETKTPLTPEEEQELYFASLREKRRKNARRLLIALAIVGVVAIGTYIWIVEKYVTGWHNSSSGRYYMSHNHRLVGMQEIDGRTYLFDDDGFLIEGPAKYEDKIYYSSANGLQKGKVRVGEEEYWFGEEDGVLRRGFYEENGVLYFRNTHGFAEEGIREIDGKVYYLSANGSVLSGWAQNEKGLRYFNPVDHSMMIGMTSLDGDTYIFDWNGYVQKGFIRNEDTLFYAETQNGALRFGKQIIDDREYYLKKDGEILNGIAFDGNKDYYFEDNAYCYGWVENEEGRFYSDKDGLYTGAHNIGGKEYYFEEDYRLARGWITRDGVKYFFDDDGAMLTGWQTIEEITYCFAETGEMFTGEHEIEGEKYFFAESGAYYDGFTETEIGKQYFVKGYLQTGVTQIDKVYYFLNENGIVTGGMQKVNGLLASYDDNGRAITGWKTVDGVKYYFGQNGVMLVGNNVIDGKHYYLSKEGGFLAQGWHTDGGKFYSYSDGSMAVGAVKIDGVLYGFNDNGYLVSKEGLQKIGGKNRYAYTDGHLAVNTQIIVASVPYTIDANGVATAKFGTINNDNFDAYLDYIISQKGTNVTTLASWVRSRVGSYSNSKNTDSRAERTVAIEAANLNGRGGACWHYATLLTAILKRAGYEAMTIKGGGHTYGEHRWTAVKINGQWMYIDAMRSTQMYTQAELDAMESTYSRGFGPAPERNGYRGSYYYKYTDPLGNYHPGQVKS